MSTPTAEKFDFKFGNVGETLNLLVPKATYEIILDPSHASDGFMGTYTGRKFSPLHPDPETVSIRDIAHALSLCCRWGGHITKFYSVAQHSVTVSQICEPEDALIGLLHDAAEAYIGDMIRPLKYLKEMYSAYKAIEHGIDSAIASKFGLTSIEKTPSVEKADTIMLCYEAINLKLKPAPWAFETLDKLGLEVLPIEECWEPKQAEQIFVKRFHELTDYKFVGSNN